MRILTHTMRPLLFLLQENYIDWMHACGGKGKCTTCKFRVIKGAENLGDLTTAEEKYRKLNALKDDERLACQCFVSGNITIAVPDENKLPHLQYSDD